MIVINFPKIICTNSP